MGLLYAKIPKTRTFIFSPCTCLFGMEMSFFAELGFIYGSHFNCYEFPGSLPHVQKLQLHIKGDKCRKPIINEAG